MLALMPRFDEVFPLKDVALLRADDVEVPHRFGAPSLDRSHHSASFQELMIEFWRSSGGPAFHFSRHFKLNSQHGCVQRVEPAVENLGTGGDIFSCCP